MYKIGIKQSESDLFYNQERERESKSFSFNLRVEATVVV